MFKYASANFYTGISETVVVVGVQRLFVAMLVLAWLFGCVAKRNRQCAKSVGSIATKSMTVKNGGNTIDAVEGLALWVSHCISRACGLAGGLQKIREERTPLLFALGIEAEILFCVELVLGQKRLQRTARPLHSESRQKKGTNFYA